MILKDEVQTVSKLTLQHDIALENTRLLKTQNEEDELESHVLQASIEQDDIPKNPGRLSEQASARVKVVRGDHAKDLSRVSSASAQAALYCSSDLQVQIL